MDLDHSIVKQVKACGAGIEIFSAISVVLNSVLFGSLLYDEALISGFVAPAFLFIAVASIVLQSFGSAVRRDFTPASRTRLVVVFVASSVILMIDLFLPINHLIVIFPVAMMIMSAYAINILKYLL
ncbi:MAG: hypothetical protein KGI66_00290 [Patescibacteria group bacterium]|nr:hypothetical protein [Patescibacteria group bacterium]